MMKSLERFGDIFRRSQILRSVAVRQSHKPEEKLDSQSRAGGSSATRDGGRRAFLERDSKLSRLGETFIDLRRLDRS